MELENMDNSQREEMLRLAAQSASKRLLHYAGLVSAEDYNEVQNAFLQTRVDEVELMGSVVEYLTETHNNPDNLSP